MHDGCHCLTCGSQWRNAEAGHRTDKRRVLQSPAKHCTVMHVLAKRRISIVQSGITWACRLPPCYFGSSDADLGVTVPQTPKQQRHAWPIVPIRSPQQISSKSHTTLHVSTIPAPGELRSILWLQSSVTSTVYNSLHRYESHSQSVRQEGPRCQWRTH